MYFEFQNQTEPQMKTMNLIKSSNKNKQNSIVLGSIEKEDLLVSPITHFLLIATGHQ